MGALQVWGTVATGAFDFLYQVLVRLTGTLIPDRPIPLGRADDSSPRITRV